jgi:hypothetical protein
MRVWIFIVLIGIVNISLGQTRYICNNGTIRFYSNASLETIEAYSDNLGGVVDAETNRFAFKLPILSFQGFNSNLQKEHFNENYLESNAYEYATFEGKIIGKIDFDKDTIYSVRAKGSLEIHGVKNEEIISSVVRIEGETIYINADFNVLLSNYNIPIPKVVSRKIAKEIKVVVEAKLNKI